MAKPKILERAVETDRTPWLFALFLVSMLPLLWFPQDQWVLDDTYVMSNPFVTEDRIVKVLTTRLWSGLTESEQAEPLYRPFLLLGAMPFEKIPLAFRLVQWLMYLLTGLCLLLWMQRKTEDQTVPWPWLALAFFLLHPMTCEVRSQIGGLSETMPLILVSLAFFIADKQPYWGLLLVSVTPGFKETGFFWILGYLAYLLREQKPVTALWGFGAWLTWAVSHWSAIGGWFSGIKPPVLLNPLAGMSFTEGLLSRLYLVGHALCQFFLPLQLSSDYSLGTLDLPAGLGQIQTLIGLGFIVVFTRYAKSLWAQGPWGTLILTTIGGSLIWNLHLFGFAGNYFGGVYTERSWLPFYFGLILWLTAAAQPLAEKNREAHRALVVGLSVFCLFLYSKTFSRQARWVNTATLLLADSIAHPRNSRLHFNYGFAQAKVANWQEARDAFKRSVEINPNFGDAHYRLSLVYGELKEPDKAKEHETKARQLGVNILTPSNN